jgi:hypothetical protein
MADRSQPALDRGEASERPERGEGRLVRWHLVLIWFMRVLALMWIAKGLVAWSTLLGLGEARFEARGIGFQATVVYFAVIDLIAAVGMWLTSTWGGVLWLLAVMSHLILAVFFPTIVPTSLVSIASFLILIVLYLAISWLAATEA